MLPSIPEEAHSLRENSRDGSDSSLREHHHIPNHRSHRRRGSSFETLRVDQSRQDSWLDRARQGVHCSLFCGGRRCKYERWSALTREQQAKCAIEGLNSNWVGEDVIASQRPSSSLFLKYLLIQQFKAKKVSVVVNLQEKGEHGSCGPDGVLSSTGYSYSGKDDFMAKGISYYEFPWPDMTAPEQDVVLRSIQVIDHHVRRKGKVLVHCHAGLGRTGLLIACYYVYRYHMSSWDAIHLVRSNRPGAIQTSRQFEFICDFERHLWRLSQAFCMELSDARVDVDAFVGRQRHILHGSESDLHRFTPMFLHKILCRLINLVRFDISKGESALKSFGISSSPDPRVLQQCRLGINRLQFDVNEINSELLLGFLVGDWFRCMSKPALSSEACNAIIQFQRCRSASPIANSRRRNSVSSASSMERFPVKVMDTASMDNDWSQRSTSAREGEIFGFPSSRTIPYTEESQDPTSSRAKDTYAVLLSSASYNKENAVENSPMHCEVRNRERKSTQLIDTGVVIHNGSSSSSPFFRHSPSPSLESNEENSYRDSLSLSEEGSKRGLGETGIMKEEQMALKMSRKLENGRVSTASTARHPSTSETTSHEIFPDLIAQGEKEGLNSSGKHSSTTKGKDQKDKDQPQEKTPYAALASRTESHSENFSVEGSTGNPLVPFFPLNVGGEIEGKDAATRHFPPLPDLIFSTIDHSLRSGSPTDVVVGLRADGSTPAKVVDNSVSGLREVITAAMTCSGEKEGGEERNPFLPPLHAFLEKNPFADGKRETSANSRSNKDALDGIAWSGGEKKVLTLHGEEAEIKGRGSVGNHMTTRPQEGSIQHTRSAPELVFNASLTEHGKAWERRSSIDKLERAAHIRRRKRKEKGPRKDISPLPRPSLTRVESSLPRQASFLSSSPATKEEGAFENMNRERKVGILSPTSRSDVADKGGKAGSTSLVPHSSIPGLTPSTPRKHSISSAGGSVLPRRKAEEEGHEGMRRLSISSKISLSLPASTKTVRKKKNKSKEKDGVKSHLVKNCPTSAIDLRRSPGMDRGLQKCSGRMGALYFLNTVTTPAVRHTIGMVLSAIETISAESTISEGIVEKPSETSPSAQESEDLRSQGKASETYSSGFHYARSSRSRSESACASQEGSPSCFSPDGFLKNRVAPLSPFFPFAIRKLSESEMQIAKRQAYRSLVDSFNHACHPLKLHFAPAERELLYDFFMECGSLIGDAYFNALAPAAANTFSRSTHRVALASKKTLEATRVTGPILASPALPSPTAGFSFSKIPVYTQCEVDTPLNRSLFSKGKPSGLTKLMVSFIRRGDGRQPRRRDKESRSFSSHGNSEVEKRRRSGIASTTYGGTSEGKLPSLSSISSQTEDGPSGTFTTLFSSAYGSSKNPLESVAYSSGRQA